jgi:hypothetical protein
MSSLIDLLKGLNVGTYNIEEKFSLIANELMRNYQIVSVSGERFDMHEIEFYFFSVNHNDNSVHRHGMDAGQWRVHYSGIDITFDGCINIKKNNCKIRKCVDCKEISSYGGILIRTIGISKNLIVGPLKVQTTLLTGGSIKGSSGLSLIENKDCNNIKELKFSTRCGVKNTNGFDDMNYCFYNGDILTEKNRNDNTRIRVAK